MLRLTEKCVKFLVFMVLMEDAKTTSIMNDVVIGKNELIPPTLRNSSTEPAKTESKDAEKVQDLEESNFLIPIKHDFQNLHGINSQTNVDEVIGRTLVDLSGYVPIDNAETILGDTVADAFLMNSWDDTEIRYQPISVICFIFCM